MFPAAIRVLEVDANHLRLRVPLDERLQIPCFGDATLARTRWLEHASSRLAPIVVSDALAGSSVSFPDLQGAIAGWRVQVHPDGHGLELMATVIDATGEWLRANGFQTTTVHGDGRCFVVRQRAVA